MRLTEDRFMNLMAELVDENPFAIRPVLKILGTEFTLEVPTLAVTLDERPRLLVNLEFLSEHCHRDEHVKACITHEFLHVLLNHTERFKSMSPVQNLALDAVINAIIHRTLGPDYSEFFLLYYGSQKGDGRLLRPVTEEERRKRSGHNPFDSIWDALYAGKLIADDILSLAKDRKKRPLDEERCLVGNHDGIGTPLPMEIEQALEQAMSSMDGEGIWRSPEDRGVGLGNYQTEFLPRNREMQRWRSRALEVLRKCLMPSPNSASDSSPSEYQVPVLSTKDRRAFMRTIWSPIMPDSRWESERRRPVGQAQVYLDVSGSMSGEMPEVIALLGLLRRYIRMPFWSFSDDVHPAEIVDGRLVTRTSGGTSMACVLRHIAKTRPKSAVVVTDGYIEAVDRRLVNEISNVKLFAIVTRDGYSAHLERAGIPSIQLEALPHG
jgi:hypothetical protein